MIKRHGGAIAEFPITVGQWGPFKIPAGGGGYLRLLPLIALRYFWEREAKDIMVIYLHPYEFNPRDFKGWEKEIPFYFRFQQAYGRATIIDKLRTLLSGKECRTMSSFVQDVRERASDGQNGSHAFSAK